MKRKLLATAVAMTTLSLAGTAVAAPESPSKERTRGAASGLVIGAVAAGPAGAFVGGILGGEVFGRLFEQHRENRDLHEQVVALESTLGDERARYAAATDALNQDLDKMLAIRSGQLKSREMPVQFRTASSDIESQYENELEKIARILSRNKDASVTLAGFTDRRGEDKANLQLSEQRVEAVKTYLMARGAGEKQILTMAFGETRPLSPSESLEGNFFDRRVVVELNLDIDPQLATR